MHGAELGFNVSVIEDACRPLDEANNRATKDKLAAAGVAVVQSEDAVSALKTGPQTYTLQEYIASVSKQRNAGVIHANTSLGAHV